jgi:hypothetical protein
MIKTRKPNPPLWAKILFETPELVHESMLMGIFPEFRKKIIDVSIQTLSYCEYKRSSFPNILKWVKIRTLHLIEWINNNWKKQNIHTGSK